MLQANSSNLRIIRDNLEKMIRQNERLIKQNDETAVQDRADTFIGTIALLISLSFVKSLVMKTYHKKQNSNTRWRPEESSEAQSTNVKGTKIYIRELGSRTAIVLKETLEKILKKL
jgi:hypothetical protein